MHRYSISSSAWSKVTSTSRLTAVAVLRLIMSSGLTRQNTIPKQLELLHELVPKADPIAFLVNPKNAVLQSDTNSMREAYALARQGRRQIQQLLR